MPPVSTRRAPHRIYHEAPAAARRERTFHLMVEETPEFVWYVINEFAARLRATNALI
jgi:hypothetical protein